MTQGPPPEKLTSVGTSKWRHDAELDDVVATASQPDSTSLPAKKKRTSLDAFSSESEA